MNCELEQQNASLASTPICASRNVVHAWYDAMHFFLSRSVNSSSPAVWVSAIGGMSSRSFAGVSGRWICSEVHLEVLLRRDPRQVWLVESRAEEERFSAARRRFAGEILLHQFDDMPRGVAVGFVFILVIRAGPGQLNVAFFARLLAVLRPFLAARFALGIRNRSGGWKYPTHASSNAPCATLPIFAVKYPYIRTTREEMQRCQWSCVAASRYRTPW